MMALPLVFSRHDYEYDVYGLLRAFFPGLELRICYSDTVDSGTKSTTASEDATAGGPPPDPGFFVCMENTQVRFFWALPADLAKELGLAKTAEKSAALTDPADRWVTKNELKRLIYRTLRAQTGRDLPWGALTGIRPTKLARRMLEGGADRQEAARRMQEEFFTGEKKATLAAEIAARELALTSNLNLKNGYSLYVHLPFCPSICLYCSFGSHPLDAWQQEVEPYLAHLIQELEFVAEVMDNRSPTAIYVGGGTPTALSADQLHRLLARINAVFDRQNLAEFTVEAGRPDTVDAEKLAVLMENGVSRISINPQTMCAETLMRIGRGHTPEQTEQAFALARDAGFANINMDMIVGLPGEGAPEVNHTLQRIEAMAPDSLTVHSLALKRAARLRLFRDEYAEKAFVNSGEIMEAAEQTATRLAMHPYYLYRQKDMAGNFENTGYARSGCEGLYNILMMEELQTVVGAGCGATTKFVYHRGAATGRVENVKGIREYIDRFDEMLLRKKRGIEEYFERREKA